MPFKIATARDLRMANGQPAFGDRALAILQSNPDIKWEWVPEDLVEVTPDVAARYDGLHLNAPRLSAASLARSDCRLKIIARHGVGFDSVDLAAATARGIVVTNTPIAIRRPVAVATLTMIFPLAGNKAGRLTQPIRLIRHRGLVLYILLIQVAPQDWPVGVMRIYTKVVVDLPESTITSKPNK